jgi:hypothetical protein
MHHCYRCHHHPPTAFPKALLLPLKLRFPQAAASTVKLVAATVLPPPPPLLPCCHHCITTVYKFKKI